MQSKDVEDIQCLSLGRIDLQLLAPFPADLVARDGSGASLVCCCSIGGLIFACRSDGFVVTSVAEVERVALTTHKTSTQLFTDFRFRAAVPTLKGRPNALSLNSDESLLAVAVEGPSGSFVCLYEVAWFADSVGPPPPPPQPFLEIRASGLASPSVWVKQLAWNPETPSSLMCLMSDSSLTLYSVGEAENPAGFTIVNTLPAAAAVVRQAACWSP